MSAFDDLLDRLAPLEPCYGWSDAHQIPGLTDEDVATVLAEADDLLADAVSTLYFGRRLSIQLASRAPQEQRYALIGAALVGELEVLARHYLVGELRARADSHVDDEAKERLHQDWRDVAADEAGQCRQGEL